MIQDEWFIKNIATLFMPEVLMPRILRLRRTHLRNFSLVHVFKTSAPFMQYYRDDHEALHFVSRYRRISTRPTETVESSAVTLPWYVLKTRVHMKFFGTYITTSQLLAHFKDDHLRTIQILQRRAGTFKYSFYLIHPPFGSLSMVLECRHKS